MDRKIKLGITPNDGRKSLLAFLEPIELFGELSLFDSGPRTVTTPASTETSSPDLGHKAFGFWLTESPGVGQALLKVLVQRLTKTNEHFSNLFFSE